MKPYCILVTMCVMLLAASCEKELDFEYHDIDPLTVIEAELTPEGAKVGITYTTPMNEPMDRTRLTDATVTLTDLTDGIAYSLHPDEEGFFVDPNPGIACHDYRLSVERAGCRYEADATMYAPTEIESLEFNWIKMPYDYVAVFQGRFLDNAAIQGECYWIKLYRNGEIYQWGEMDDRSAVDGISTFFTMTTRMDTDEEDDDTVLFDGDVITCTVSPISRAMHDYLEALQNDSNGPAMFSGDKCLGYFLATSPVSASVVFHPDELPEYK
ncbi:MAG: DUF4249 domain-containing protein [Muribaculaceae bacterium]|nr:DUF4249 domain-containing protein [Muribaculaceae bacterium]